MTQTTGEAVAAADHALLNPQTCLVKPKEVLALTPNQLSAASKNRYAPGGSAPTIEALRVSRGLPAAAAATASSVASEPTAEATLHSQFDSGRPEAGGDSAASSVTARADASQEGVTILNRKVWRGVD